VTRSERIYRVLLRAYPRSTREACGDDMAQLLTDRLRDARSNHEAVSVWIDTLGDLVRTAPRDRLLVRRRRQLVEGPVVEPERVPMKRDAALASVPIVVSLLIATWRPAVLGSMVANPPGIMGLPLGMAILVMFAILASLGILAARRNRELNDPWHQSVAMLAVLVSIPWVALQAGFLTAIVCAMVAPTAVLLARFRRLMLALTIPFLVWLIVGPGVMAIFVAVVTGMAAE
jgi:hypothetical protein